MGLSPDIILGRRNEASKPPERPVVASTFEHMFPGNQWDQLQRFNPLNVPVFLRMITKDLGWHEGAGEAIRTGQGYAYRFDLPYPDQLTVGLELADILPTHRNAQAQQGWFGELMNQGEIVGGMGVRVAHWAKPMTERPHPFAPEALRDPKILYETAEVKTVGVMREDNKPSGVIVYREGPRKRKEKRELWSFIRPEERLVTI